MRLFVDYSPKRRRNILWAVFTVIIILLAVTIAILFISVFKSNYILLTVSGIALILLIVLTYILGIIISHWQYYAESTRNDFTNNIVHEIKTPITVISLACELLLDKNLEDKPTREEQVESYLPIIASETERLKKMVDIFLQHSRINSSHFALNIEQFDIHQMISHVVESSEILVRNSGGVINRHLSATNNMIEADQLQIANVITNILDNAVKYSDGAPEISVTTADTHNGIVVKISDKGIGMSKNALEHIFENFYRVPTGDRHDVKGYGIGLNYALRIVQMHGGDIKVHSELGKGSEFDIFLPMHPKIRK